MAVSGDSVLVRSLIAKNITRIWQKNGFLGAKNITEVGFYTVGRLGKKGRVGVRAALQVGLEDVKKLEGNFVFDVVSEGELKEKGFLRMRKTKQVCTIGPACCSVEDLEKLAAGGMNVARLNMCHNTREWHLDVINKIRRLNEENGFCVSVMIDTEGSQIHVVDHGAPSTVKAEEGSVWLFTAEQFDGLRPFTVQANYEGSLKVLKWVIYLLLMVEWQALSDHNLDFSIFNSKLFKHEGQKDWADIEFGISEGVDFISLSFVNNADSISEVKNYLSTKSSRCIRVLAKIESLESLQKLEEIVEASDGIMVARGDLGVEVPLEQIPTVQEEITRVCRELNKPVIVASQLLESMVEYPTPTRAEVADVSEAVRQFADALMLSGESAIGSYGQKALAVLRMASSRMELWSREENKHILHQRQLGVSLPDRIAEQICNCAVEMANNLGVDAIFVYTKYGHMASLLSRNRPCPPIFAFTNDSDTRMALNLQWGVIPLLVDLSDDMEGNISRTMDLMKTKGMVKPRDVVLLVSDLIPTIPNSSAFQAIQVKKVD
ncbi:hypothetical protein SLA2020_314540 [Shorea laevis]